MGILQSGNLVRRDTTPSTRRGILGAIAGGGVLAALGLRPVSQALAAGPACVLDTTVTIRLGASAGQMLAAGAAQPGQIRGQLQFEVLANGTLGNAAFRLADGTALAAVGQAAGYALQARIALGNGQHLILMGVGEQEIVSCQGAMDGLASGPQPGDLGDWQAMATSLGNGAVTGAAAPVAAAPMTPTPAPAQPSDADPAGCPEGLIRCWDSCVDMSSDPTHCGDCDHACVGSATCIEGVCILAWECLEGTVECNGQCVDLKLDPFNCGACGFWCLDGEACNEGVCDWVTPPEQCKPDGDPCGSHNECCSNYCSNGGSVCSTPLCQAAGMECLNNWDCCSGICNTFDYSYTCA